MRKIGLIGSMSFESSIVYYWRLNELVRAHRGGFHSAEVIISSVNFAEIVDCQVANRSDDATHTANVRESRICARSALSHTLSGADCSRTSLKPCIARIYR